MHDHVHISRVQTSYINRLSIADNNSIRPSIGGLTGHSCMRGNMQALIAHRAAIIIIVGLILIRANSAKDTLHIGVLVSVEGDLNLSGYIPAMNIALERINNDSTLPFDFNVTLNDSMVRARLCIYIIYIYILFKEFSVGRSKVKSVLYFP